MVTRLRPNALKKAPPRPNVLKKAHRRIPLSLLFAAAYSLVLILLYRTGREAARLHALDTSSSAVDEKTGRKERKDRRKSQRTKSNGIQLVPFHNCLDSTGPIPVILLSRGRSGTGSMWQVLGSLTGKETPPSDEYTGSNFLKSETFFHNVGPSDGGKWVLDVMCYYQKKYRRAALVGFKWKPFREPFFSPASRNGLELVAKLANDTGSRSVRVVRSRRNPLDVLISQTKHALDGKKKGRGKVAPHCMRGDEECLKKHLEAGTAIRLETVGLIRTLREATDLEDDVDKFLAELGVPVLYTTFERTHHASDPRDAVEEWMRIFRFLGVGPGEGLTPQQLDESMQHMSTSHQRHSETIDNYEEVADLLAGTEFEDLLH